MMLQAIPLSEDDFLTRLVLEGEGYIAMADSAMVLQQIAALVEAGQQASYRETVLALNLVLPADYNYSQYLVGQLRASDGRRPVGYFILAKGYSKPTQVLEALEEQVQCGGRIGEIMVRNGWLTEEHVTECLALQRADAEATSA